MATYPFLSDEWFVEVRRVFETQPIDVPAGAALRMNLLVTDTPFGADRQVHVLVADGVADFGHGHVGWQRPAAVHGHDPQQRRRRHLHDRRLGQQRRGARHRHHLGRRDHRR